MANLLLVMEIDEALKQLLHDAFNLGDPKLDLLVDHASQIEIEVLEDKVKAASVLVALTWFTINNLQYFDYIIMV